MTAELNEKLSELLSDAEMLEIRAQVRAEIELENAKSPEFVGLMLNENQIEALRLFNPRRKTKEELADAGINGAIKALVYSARESARKAKDVAFRAGNQRGVEYHEEQFQIANKLHSKLG